MFRLLFAAVLALASDPALARCPNTRPVSCGGPTPFRTLDGSCNNPIDPTTGMANTPFVRVLPAQYSDGVHGPRRARSGRALPSARQLVTTLLPDRDVPSTSTNGLVMSWAQLVSHDIARIQAPFPRPNTRCCAFANATDTCDRILVPANDRIYRRPGLPQATCIGVDRSAAAPCLGASFEQTSTVTHYMDASFVYGSNVATMQRLREGRGGRLRTQIIMADEFLPMSSDGGLDAGDARVTITPMLAALQTLFMREHNRVARRLTALNPLWSDERTFQETRRVVTAQWQLLSFRDWLQWIIGTDTVQQNSLLPSTRTYSQDYNASVPATVSNDFSSAAYRSFHSMVPDEVWLGGGGGEPLQVGALNDVSADAILSTSGFRRIILGMVFQPRQTQDQFTADEISGGLFRGSNSFGGDLMATDIARGREHGLPGYNDFRELCDLPRAKNFSDFGDTITSAENIRLLGLLYEDPDDVDFIVGGLLEQIDTRDPLASVTSPVFRCVVLDQFRRLKSGDRYFFDLRGPGALSLAQLATLGRQSVARLICDNVPGVRRIPVDPFLRLGVLGNREVNCNEIRGVDYAPWRENRFG